MKSNVAFIGPLYLSNFSVIFRIIIFSYVDYYF